MKKFHHRGAEFAEIGAFLTQELFTPRPPRLRGTISESYFTEMPEVPKNLIFRSPAPEIFQFLALPRNVLLIPVDLLILLPSLVFTPLQLIAD